MPNSISLDAGTLRLCQLDAAQWRRPFSSDRCEHVFKHRDEYLQIENDNPNLIWLYTLMLKNEVELPKGPIIAAMKQMLLKNDSLTPLAWRYIANGTADDFRLVLGSTNPGEEPQWRFHLLLAWLEVLLGLRLKAPIAEPIQELFLHDGLVVEHDRGEVLFRGAWMTFATLRHIIKEAEKRLAASTLREFAETELVEVVTWLAATAPDLDNNQTRKGWKYLLRSATEWKSDIERMATYQKLRWFSVLPELQIDQWTIKPVIDAWSLHRLAISQRHCGDRFIQGCVDGKERIFEIVNPAGKIVATLRLTLHEKTWKVGDMKGFANSDVSPEIRKLGDTLAHYYI